MSFALVSQPAVAQPPQPPTAPTAPVISTPSPVISTPSPVLSGAETPARTKEELKALTARRDELRDQRNAVEGRREKAVKEMLNAPSEALRTSKEQLVKQLDARILRIEADIEANGRAIAFSPEAQVAATQSAPRYGPFSSGQLTAISVISILGIWMPLAIAGAVTMLRRWAHAKPAPAVLENAARLERMEQAIDAVAIEVERISEGQRFVTQLMAKRESAPMLNVGAAPAEPVSVEDASRVAR
jgi:hypothetical protein